MSNIDSKTWRAARQALDKAISFYLNDPNVSHIDLGYRFKDNQFLPELVVRVHVYQKFHGEEFEQFAADHPDRVIDSQKIGFAVDVIEATYSLQGAIETTDLPGGKLSEISNSNENIQRSGIPGIKVRDCESGQEMILTTWHVLAGRWRIESSPSIFQTEGESIPDEKLVVARYCRDAMIKNLDAAIVQFESSESLNGSQIHWQPVAGAGVPQLGMAVKKLGTGSDVISGIVTGILGYSIHICDGRKYLIGPTIHVSPAIRNDKICASSDSGVVWQDSATSRAIGLHFVGEKDGRCGLALSMPEVLSALKIEIIPGITRKKKQRWLQENVIHVGNKTAQLCFVIFFSIALFKFNFHQSHGIEKQEEKLENIEILLNKVKAIAQIEWERQNAIEKIVTIMNQHNPGMNTELKLKIADEIFDMSKKYRNLDIELICATITHETALTWNPGIVSPAGAIGLMQIMPVTGKLLAEEQGTAFQRIDDILVDPITNIRLGCHYLSSLIEAYTVDGGLAAYNGDMKRAERWVRNGRIKGILHEETEFYVPTILKFYEQYQ